MSLLNKTPYLNSVLSDLSSDELSELVSLINGSGTFVYRSLVDKNNLLTDSDKMKAVNLQLANGKPLVSGWFLGDAFIQYFPDRPEMQMYAIDLDTMTYEVIKETFTATDLRCALSGGSGGGTDLEYATNAEIDALFGIEPIEYATFEVETLTNCLLSGISDGDQIAIGQSLTFTVTGTESNLVRVSISNNGVTYTMEEIASMVTGSGDNWFEFTIPAVNGNIVISFEFEIEESEE